MNFELDCDYFNRAGDKVRYVGYTNYDDTCWFRKNGNLLKIGFNGFCVDGRETEYDILGKWEITDDPDRVYVDKQGKEWKYHEDGYFRFSEIEKILIKPLDIKPSGIFTMPAGSICPYCKEIYDVEQKHTCTYPEQEQKKKWDTPGEMERAVNRLGTGIASKDLAYRNIKDSKKYQKLYNDAFSEGNEIREANQRANEEIRTLLDSMVHLKKIEPLKNEIMSCEPRELAVELIAAKKKINELIAAHNKKLDI